MKVKIKLNQDNVIENVKRYMSDYSISSSGIKIYFKGVNVASIDFSDMSFDINMNKIRSLKNTTLREKINFSNSLDLIYMAQ